MIAWKYEAPDILTSPEHNVVRIDWKGSVHYEAHRKPVSRRGRAFLGKALTLSEAKAIAEADVESPEPE